MPAVAPPPALLPVPAASANAAMLSLPGLLACLCDADGRVLDISPAWSSTSGYAPDALRGRPFALLCPDAPPADLFRPTGADAPIRVPQRRQDGTPFWLELNWLPVGCATLDGVKGDGEAGGNTPANARWLVLAQDPTRLMRAELAAQRGDRRFRGLAETISAAVMLHRRERLLYVNGALERITGHARSELLRMPLSALAAPGHPDLLSEHGLALLEGRPVPERYQTAIRSHDGDIRWLEVTAIRIEYEEGHAVLTTAIDVSAARQAEEDRNQFRQLLQQIIEGDPVPTFVIDAEHRVTHWNRACALVTGMPAAEMVGRAEAWRAFYDGERPVLADLIVDGAIDDRIDTFYRGKYRRSPVIPNAYEAESFFPHFGEGGRWLYFTAAPVQDTHGRLIGAIETLVDISERKAAEAALQRAHDSLEHLVERRTAQLAEATRALEADVRRREQSENELRQRHEELQAVNARLKEAQAQLVQSEKLASIGQLAAGVAHEINNPVGYLLSNLSTLERYLDDYDAVLRSQQAALGELPADHPARQEVARVRAERDFDFLREDLPELMRQSREGLDRVRRIVADLKDFSRLDASQDWEWADLHRGLDSTLNIVNNEIKYHASVEREYGSLPQVQCLPSQLNQVFLNLLVNAAQAMPDGRLGRILIRSGHEPASDTVWVEFEDDGNGIPPAIIDRIFDPFFTTKPVGKGTGLGLSLSYGIIRKHKGEFRVHSRPGEGTTFRIVLPVRQGDEGPGVAEGTPPPDV